MNLIQWCAASALVEKQTRADICSVLSYLSQIQIHLEPQKGTFFVNGIFVDSIKTKFAIVAQTCNPHSLEAEAEACLKFEASMGYIVSSKLAWLMA